MLISDEVRKCVAYIGYRLPTSDIAFKGTAFFVGCPIEDTEKHWAYVVTAKHVIQKISDLEGFNGKICLRVNIKGGEARTIETDVDKWVFHPDETEVDIAVYPHIQIKDFDIVMIPFSMFSSQESRKELEFSIGEEVFLTGLFYNHRGRHRNIPIVRMGNVVALPEEKIKTGMGFIDAYLVESRSIGGLSGSPVFVNYGITRIIENTRKHYDSKYGSQYLLGIMHGHWDIDLLNEDHASIEEKKKETVNMGIAIVTPIEKLLEVLNQPRIREVEISEENQLREK